ncbi:MAG: ribosome maturation factor RimM [Snowella sp.]
MNTEESFVNTKWIEIGTIVAPQGLQGELRVSSSSDFPERFEEPGTRWLQSPKGEPPVIVELLGGRCIPGKNIYVIQLKGIDNRENAEALRNYKLLVPESDRPQLEVDEYHVSELIGLVVYNQLTGEQLGKISDVFFSGNDILEVELFASKNHSEIEQELTKTKKNKTKPAKPATILIPFVKEIVPVVDISGGRIEINPPQGLLEIN